MYKNTTCLSYGNELGFLAHYIKLSTVLDMSGDTILWYSGLYQSVAPKMPNPSKLESNYYCQTL